MSSASAPSLPEPASNPTVDASPAGVAAAAAAAANSNVNSIAPPEEEPYYWERNAAGPAPDPLTVVKHNLHWFTWQLLGGVEYVGEIFSEMFGMMNARYEWAAAAEQNRIVSWRDEIWIMGFLGMVRFVMRHHAASAQITR